MGLKQVGLADVLGVSDSSVSRMKSGAYLLRAEHKEWELAAYNTALRDAPINLIGKVTGLTRTVDYEDAYRARV